jgi:diguanylate cyclase (GGDEF)-like protein/PAS domain S-box-containing protein
MTMVIDPLTHPERLAALHAAGVLDAPPDAAFDRVAALAAALLRAPFATVSFLDIDRQFVAGSHGLPEDGAYAREAPLSHSFCQHVVRGDGPFVVTDARTDPRVRDNPLADGAVVAYVGVPFRVGSHVLGSVCVVDVVPRAWSADDVAGLARLADSVTTELALRGEVAERRRAEAALRAGEAQYRGLLERLPYIVYENAPAPPYRPVYVSPAVEALGFDRDAWRERPDFWLEILHPDDRDRVLRETERARALGAPVDYEYRVHAADGAVRWLHDRGALVRGDDGLPVVWQGVLVDITPRKRLEAELTRQASEDGLTGLANRTRLRARMERALAGAAPGATPGTTPAVLLIDLDDFKRVNDSLGHAAGDRLLEQVADRLLAATRGSDTVARLGGDEFAVLLGGVHAGSEVAVVADRIVGAMAAPFLVDGREIRAAASIGVAVATPTDTPDDLLRNADLALYRAKGAGKGRHEAFAPELHTAAITRLELEAELRWAIANEELVLHYQPIVDLGTGSIAGAEALVRWQHPRRGMVSPADFIPLAETTDLVVPLGRWVLHAACRAAAEWPEPGCAGGGRAADGLPVSVNVSGRQLQRPGFVEDVTEALRVSGLAPARLTLEVTESVLLADLDVALMRLEAIRALGVRVSLDDFGTGYSSLAYLQRLPVDVLKIDRSFTSDVVAGGKRAALARAVITIADTLGLSTVAEGVETEAQHAELCALGCGFGQGFLYARPIAGDAFVQLIAAPEPGIEPVPEPVAAAVAETPAPAVPAVPAPAAGTVLVVEDEPLVRRAVRRVLEGAGYAVLEAPDGAEALRSLAGRAGGVELVLSDVVMPELNGRALAEALATCAPATRVLLMSGYDPDAGGPAAADVPMLAKPFTPERLLAAVRDALAPASV